ncbi:DUF2304 domain-containing protein [Candidatus Falkowbacteria bacterium]|jgi:hypothetical protein|nr:DUF2304 domain-containing protein [Patescibacteria group bacterium]MDD3434947.1 DUF2304 domain-containing protein [Patescibacteria group bacterium]MDD4466364.1 DUF2304 domain-containing protein [Patescibacteria group bacterium]NCU43068.1 DUF2304 domain-containing protein [Candidatus Falkowbacteria bacterium]
MFFSWQQIAALIVIILFAGKLFKQKRKKQINGNEFSLWLIFWTISALAIIFLKPLDKLTTALGLSANGINLLFYLASLILFYLVFKMRLHLARLEQDLTVLTRQEALRQASPSKNPPLKTDSDSK